MQRQKNVTGTRKEGKGRREGRKKGSKFSRGKRKTCKRRKKEGRGMSERTVPVCTLPWIGTQWIVLAREHWHEDLRLHSYCVCVCVWREG